MKDNRSWCLPPKYINLRPKEAHVWRASLNLSDRYLSQLAQTLSDDELLRADCFRFERDRRRFVAGRGVLRSILGYYLCAEPSQLHFCYGLQGKPYLAKEFRESVIQFSLAHSHELAIYAFTLGREIGVDLEYVRVLRDAEKMAERFFSIKENAAWLELPVETRQDAFYLCWTFKEAYAKALGSGLDESLDQLNMSRLLSEPDQLSCSTRYLTKAIRWSLETLVPLPGYVGALAMEGSEYNLSYYQWCHECSAIRL